MLGYALAQYNTETVFTFSLVGLDMAIVSTPVHASGDSKISKDGGSPTNTTNGFTKNGTSFSITLTAAELSAKEIQLQVIDQSSPKVWWDASLKIETYGHASAKHPNLGIAMRGTDNAYTGTPPTAGAIADQIWDEAKSGHVASGSFGEEVQAHSLSTEVSAVNTIVTDTRRIVKNKLTIDEDNSTLQLWNDDGTAVLYTWALTDNDGAAISLESGMPANRGVPA